MRAARCGSPAPRARVAVSRLVQGQIEVVARDPVDRAVHDAVERLMRTAERRRERSRSTNGSAMRSASRADDSGTGSRLGSSCDREGSTAAIAAIGTMHCVPLRPASTMAALIQSRPKASGRSTRERPPISSRRTPDSVASASVRIIAVEAVAKGQSPQPQPLLFDRERALLVSLLLVELQLRGRRTGGPTACSDGTRATRSVPVVFHRRRNSLTRFLTINTVHSGIPRVSPTRG